MPCSFPDQLIEYWTGARACSSSKSRKSRGLASAVPVRAGAADVRVQFANGSDKLDNAGKQDVRAFASALQSSTLASSSFVVEGHTNSTGTRSMNMDLSQRRAQAVLDYLVQLGVSPSRLQAKGFGFDKPRVANAADPLNRRVEVVRAK
jgi:outer membrane protein OmpA-like peptidoglycan-associated protein